MITDLQSLLDPTSIAVVGASERVNSVGLKVFKNLLEGHFEGKLYAVNPKHNTVCDQPCFPTVSEINDQIDLAIITTPAETVPAILTQCGEKKIPAAIIISSGFSETGPSGKALQQTVSEIALKYHIRIIGPNCLGVIRPHLKMNATFDNNTAMADGLALVSQSGAISAAILDWAANKKIGFSALVSLGNCMDVDFGDVLEYLAHDPKTKSILLYIEGVHQAQRFMSGLRAATRVKPVIVIKAGKKAQGSRAALSHTGAMMGNDDVFDAALKRAGAVRVDSIEALFSAAEILSSHHSKIKGNRLLIITNGGGAGVMAADQASELNVSLQALSESAITELNKVLPSQWSHQNPIDIIGDATPERYHAALEVCAKEDVDGILTILVPVSMSSPLDVAKQVIDDASVSDKLMFASWMGCKQVMSSWDLFAKNNIPQFDTPEKAVAAFSYLADYYFNQQLLTQIPKSTLPSPAADIKQAKAVIQKALSEKRNMLTTIESKEVLKAFLIPIAEPLAVNTPDEAVKAASSLGFPVVMKINSPDISHKLEVNGVILNIQDEAAVREAFTKIINNAKSAKPNANILGATVERMLQDNNNREIMIGVITDKVFGPVISFGAGGSYVEIIKDQAYSLPPLNAFLAERLIQETRIAKALDPFRHMPKANSQAIIDILLRVSEMVSLLPEIQEMDINPILVNDKEAIAVDARISVTSAVSQVAYSHLAIPPST